MKSSLKALVIALVILCSVPMATASTSRATSNRGNFAVAGTTTIYRTVSPSYAQRSGSFVILSGSEASHFQRKLTLGDRTVRGAELLLGLFGYGTLNSPSGRKGLRAFVDRNSAATLRSAAASVRSFAATLPDSSEPNLLVLLGLGLMGSSLLVLRKRHPASA